MTSPETSVWNYHSALHNILKERRSTWWYGNTGLGLFPHGPVPNNPVWCRPVQPWMRKCNTASHV